MSAMPTEDLARSRLTQLPWLTLKSTDAITCDLVLAFIHSMSRKGPRRMSSARAGGGRAHHPPQECKRADVAAHSAVLMDVNDQLRAFSAAVIPRDRMA